jgi:F0F1-type ATP synthase epsilon subunit
MRNQQVNYNGLNDVQIGLLRMFARPMTKEQSLKIKRGIVNLLSDELDIEVERAVKEKGITEKDFEALRNDHQRTPKNK